MEKKKKKRNANLYAEISSIDIVSQEQISSLGRVAADLKELHQVIVLAVDVTADRNRRVHF